MPKMALTLGIAVAAVAGLAAFNAFFEPTRITAAQEEKAKKAEEKIAQAEAAVEESASKEADGSESADPAEQAAQATQSPQAADAGSAAPPEEASEESTSAWPDEAPDRFKVKLACSNGDIILEVHKDWAPLGAQRYYDLVRSGFYDECRFFRVIKGFMAQIGIAGDPKAMATWRKKPIKDDPVRKSNRQGTLSFATSGKNTRTTQFFINYGDNSRLDNMGFAPFAEVVKGMDVALKINGKHVEKPEQGMIQEYGNEYLNKVFPDLDYIKKATLVKESPVAAPAESASETESSEEKEDS